MQSPTSALKLSTSEVSGMALARELTLIVRDSGIEHALCPVYPPGGRPAFMPAAEIPPVPGNLSRRGRDW